MAKINVEKIKKQILEKSKNIDIDAEINVLKSKLPNLSDSVALIILANKKGVKVYPDRPKAVVKTIGNLKDGDDYVEIAGAVVQVYDIRFYEICPECGKRAKEISGAFKCEKHSIVTSPAYGYVLNMFIDDGDQIRVTLFSKTLERLFNKGLKYILDFKDNPDDWEDVKNDLLGKLLAFRGKVKKNDRSGRLEFNAKLVFTTPEDVTPRVEAVTTMQESQEKIPDNDLDEVEEEVIKGEEE